MDDYLLIANSPILWVITILAVLLILVQSIAFLRKSFRAGNEIGLDKEVLNLAFKTGAVSAVGPSVVIVVGMVSLLITVGAPTALMRLSYIGNVAYELMSVGFASDAYGVSLNTGALTPKVFVTALWCMAIGCVGWIVFTALFTNKMDKILCKVTGGRKNLVTVISTAAMLGAYGYLNAGYIVSFDSNTVALAAGFFSMICITLLHRKTKNKFLNEWGLTLAMFLGMIAAALTKVQVI